jgi:NADP-dependent 3-hydroxy acid dehydrogenase YdfG
MKHVVAFTGALLLALAVGGPFAVQPPRQRLALELQDYAALPITADNTNDNTRAQLARVNYLRDEQGIRPRDRRDRCRAGPAAVDQYGRIDVILNNAGVMPHSPLERRKVDDWNRTIDVNIKGVLHGIAAALPHMQRQKSGHFINVSSVAGHRVGPGSAVYAATKTAVRVISEGLRQEVKPWNLRTTIISPGAVATELPSSITEADVAQGIGQFYEQFAISADSFARAVAFAISQPEDVDINEILFRPTRQEL